MKKEEKRRNDEEFSHTVKNFRRLHDAIMPFIYNYDGEDSDWRCESIREHQEAEVLHQLYAFLEALPGAGDIDLICAFCGVKLSGFRDKKIDKFDFYPKALWEQMDLGFGEIVRPFLENEWRYVK